MYSIEALMMQIDEPISKVSFQHLFSRINITHTRLPEQLSVGFTLYKVVNGNEIYITSDSDGGYGNYFEAEAVVTLSKGTYKLYAYYRGETKSDGSVTTYNSG